MHEQTMLDPPPPARLAPAIGGLAGPLRDVLDGLRRLGFRAVQLDVRDPALRPDGLSASGRRDVLATLRRRELALAGIDCLVPPRDLADPATSDRAVEHVLAVIRLAADLGRAPVSMRLPRGAEASAASTSTSAAAPRRATVGGPVIAAAGDPGILAAAAALEAASARGPAGGLVTAASTPARRESASDPSVVVAALAAAADRHGVTLVDHAVPPAGDGPVRAGVDAAACLAAGIDPVVALVAAGDAVGALRLADLTDDGRRVPPGHPEGRLDLAGLAAAVAAGGLDLPLVLDVRQCGEPWPALREGATRWAELAS